MEDYKSELQGRFHSVHREQGSTLSPKAIARELRTEHQWGDDEYIGGRERGVLRCIHVPNVTGVVLPGRANPVEEYFRGNPEQLLVQRLGIAPEKAGKVMDILKKRGFKITP